MRLLLGLQLLQNFFDKLASVLGCQARAVPKEIQAGGSLGLGPGAVGARGGGV